MKNSGWQWKELLGIALFLLIFPGVSTAAVQTKIYQCANYKAGTGDHDTCESWINGNINEQKASYFEGDSVAYRLHVKGLTVGHSYTATIEWDATQGDKNALDYLTTVNRTVANADPCDGLALSGGCDKNTPDDIMLIPVDANVEEGRDRTNATADDIVQETPHHLRIWNADITGLGAYVYDPLAYDYLTSTKISIPITFTAEAADVLLAWGGRISTRQDWGEAYSAINISGSPYHMRLLTVIHDADGDIVASGNRDLQLSASAVFFPISLTVEKTTDRATSDWFGFTTNLTSPDNAFSLQSNGTKTLVIGESTTIAVTETDPGSSWDLESITCLNMLPTTPVPQTFTPINSGFGASLDLDEGAIVKCTFHNIFTGLPLLVVEKKVIAATESCGTVNFDGTDDEQLNIASGDSVKYCYRVKNTGEAAAYNVTLADDAAGLSAAFPVTLSGGDIATLDGVGIMNDLDINGQTFGEALVAINEPTDSVVINTATADASNTDPVSDTARVDVVDGANCTVTATVTTGTCPGSSNVIDVIEETSLTWCAEICWPGNANSNLSIATDGVELLNDNNPSPPTSLDPAVISGPFTIAPGACATASLPETLGTDSVARILKAVGSDGFQNSETCQANATADVYNPDIEIEKKVSLDSICGNSDDADSQEVYSGTDVWYCFTVSNTHEGAEGLINVQFSDATLALVDVAIGSLAAGGSWNSQSYGPYNRTAEVSNTATVSGEGELTGTQVSDTDTAIVTVVYVDIIVEKSGTNSLDVDQGESDIEYILTVWNDGTTTAIDVELVDILPDTFVYGSDDAGCSYDASGHDLTCDLGDIAPGVGNAQTITVLGTLAVDHGYNPLENSACAWPDNTETPDVDLNNNCDDTTTRITTGATRTIGWWGNHPDMMGECLAANDDLIEVLGFVELATVENAIGIIKTNIAHDLCKDKRDDLTKARLQAGRQVLAAFCNVTYLGAAEPGWMEDAQTILEGEDTTAIMELGGMADEFNNSGDEEPLPIGISPEHANPHFAWTDPTSPATCSSKARGKRDEVTGSGGGCSIGNGSGYDPMLPLLLIGSTLVILLVRRKKGGEDNA